MQGQAKMQRETKAEMTFGEKYTVFFLLLAERSSLKQVLEGTHTSDGAELHPPQPPASGEALNKRGQDALQELGIVNYKDPRLGDLFIEGGTVGQMVSMDPAEVAAAISLDYGGNCPVRRTEKLLLSLFTGPASEKSLIAIHSIPAHT